jgi:hypothetical protein
MENVGIFYANLEYIMAVWYILWSIGMSVVILYIFPRFGILRQENLANLILVVKYGTSFGRAALTRARTDVMILKIL